MGKQKRSENTYQKINTLYKRDINNIIMQHYEWSCEEFEYLRGCLWDASEKIDGTNMRIEVTSRIVWDEPMEPSFITGVEFNIVIKGKTDNAQIPSHLEKYMKETFTDIKVYDALGIKKFIPIEEWAEHGWCVSKEDPTPMYEKIPEKYTLYGEGYGMKIQKGGGRYLSNSVSFRGFDVKVNDTYLLRDNAMSVFEKLGADTVPYFGRMTIDEAIEMVRAGFISTISEDRTLMAEGLVLSSPLGLKNRRGERLIVKIKYGDFVKYRNKYGTDEKVEQTPNPHL
jgi:hypothetical protein